MLFLLVFFFWDQIMEINCYELYYILWLEVITNLRVITKPLISCYSFIFIITKVGEYWILWA